MKNKKFDYSNDMMQDNDSHNESENKAILRYQRLKQRNNALANEFRDLKPEIGRAYNCLCSLIEKSGAFSKTMLNLLDLLKTALPLRLADADKKALQDELRSIADSAKLFHSGILTEMVIIYLIMTVIVLAIIRYVFGF